MLLQRDVVVLYIGIQLAAAHNTTLIFSIFDNRKQVLIINNKMPDEYHRFDTCL